MYFIHGLSQQGVWASFWTPKPLKSTSQDTQIFLWGIFLNLNLKHIIDFFHLHVIPMTLYMDIMPYFDKFIHVYVWNLSILWSPLKIWTPKNVTIANFRHPVSKSWLSPWFHLCLKRGISKIIRSALITAWVEFAVNMSHWQVSHDSTLIFSLVLIIINM